MINNLTKATSVDRYERKWAVGGNVDTNAFLIAISRSNFMFTESYSARNINTIYFDDTNFSSIYENLDGVSYKKKYRLRWYGDPEIISKPQLEIKSKIGLITASKIISSFLLGDNFTIFSNV